MRKDTAGFFFPSSLFRMSMVGPDTFLSADKAYQGATIKRIGILGIPPSQVKSKPESPKSQTAIIKQSEVKIEPTIKTVIDSYKTVEDLIKIKTRITK